MEHLHRTEGGPHGGATQNASTHTPRSPSAARRAWLRERLQRYGGGVPPEQIPRLKAEYEAWCDLSVNVVNSDWRKFLETDAKVDTDGWLVLRGGTAA